MLLSTWLWRWLEQRGSQTRAVDPLAEFARLTVRRLEDRRVLTATLTSGVDPNVVVSVTDVDTVTITSDGTNLTISDTDGGSADIVIALADIDSLTFQGDAAQQDLVFGGGTLIDLAALNITSGIENVAFNQDVLADEGGVTVNVSGDITFGANADLQSTVNDVALTAGNDLLMDVTSSVTADVGNVSLAAGDDLTANVVHAGLGVTLNAGATSGDGSLLQVTGQQTADAGNVAITGADAVEFTADGDVTVTDGTLTVTAGTDATDTLTMADGTVFSVNSATTTSVELSAGGDIALGEISGTNLGLVTILSTDGAISDATAAETANITATSLSLSAATGIGVGDGINTQVSAVEAGTTTGGIFLDNIGALTIGGVDLDLDGIDVTGASGAIAVTATGSILVNEGVSGPGNIALTATGSASDLTISVNSGVASTGGNVLLSADRTVTISEDVSTTGTGTLTVTGNGATGARNIIVNSGAVVSTENGNLTFDADQGTQQTGNFVGILITGVGTEVKVTGTGDLSLTGRGGNDAAGGQNGVSILSGGVVRGGTSGTVTITGTGGASGGNGNHGVRVDGAGAAITSSGGNVQVTGQGGGTGASGSNHGVFVVTGGQITAGGLGSVTVQGTGGGSSGHENFGVSVLGTGAAITSSGGNVQVTGQGGGSGASVSNHGVYVLNAGTITAGGMGAVTVAGTGGASNGNSNYGVLVSASNTVITSSGGNVQVTGQGGGSGASGFNYGVHVRSGAQITAGGMGTVTVAGTGGASSGNGNRGVFVTGSGAAITSSGGEVKVTGTEGGGTSGLGIMLSSGGSIAHTNNGNVTLVANSMQIDGTSSVGAGSGVVTVRQLTDTVGIHLGSTTDTIGGPLSLSDAELDRITAGTLVIGNANTGDITLKNAISPANVTTLQLNTGGGVIDDTATEQADIIVANLAINAATGIGAADDIDLQVSNLAFRNTTSGAVALANSGALTIAAVGTLDGTAGNEVGNFGNGTTSLVAASPVTVAINTTSVGSMTITAGETSDAPAFDDDLTINNGVTVSVTGVGNTLTLQAGDDVLINGTATATQGDVIVTAGFNDADASGNILIEGAVTAQGLVQLTAETGIDDGVAGVITAATLELLGSGNALLDNGHLVDEIAADLNGGLTFVNQQGFIVGTAGGTNGITLTQNGAALDLTATTGAISLAQNVVTSDGTQTYHSAVQLLADVSVDAGVGNVDFQQTIDGTYHLQVQNATDVIFQGAIGATDELAALTVNAVGTVTVNADVQLGQDGTHPGTFSVNANEFVLNASIDTQDADPLGGGTVSIVASTITLNGGIITDEGNVDLNGPVILQGATTIETETGSVSFLNSIDGAGGGEALTVTSTAGGVILVSGAIGTNQAIGALTLSSTAAAGTVSIQNGVTTVGNVTISAETILIDGAIDTTGAIVDQGHVVLTSTSLTALTQNITTNDGDITLNGFTRVDTSLTLQSATGDVHINGALDSNDPGGPPTAGLTIVATTGDVFIMADLGTGATPGSSAVGLAFLNVTAGADLYACGTWIIDTTVTFTSAVYLCDDLSITANGDVDFQQTVDQANTAVQSHLTVNANGVTFNGVVGGQSPLSALTVTATGDVRTSDDVTTVGSIAITTAGGTGYVGGGAVTSQNGAIVIAANGSGDIQIDGNVQAQTGINLSTTGGVVGPGSITVNGTSGLTTATGNLLVTADDTVTIVGGLQAQGTVFVTTQAGAIDIGGNVNSNTLGVTLQSNLSNSALVNTGIHVGGNVTAATTVTAQSTGGLAGSGFVDIDGLVSGSSVQLTGQTGTVAVGSTVTATTGAVTASGTAVTIGGTVTADQNITLTGTNGNVQVTGSVISTNGGVTLDAQQAGNLVVTGDVSARNQALLSTVNGAGGGTVTVGGGVTSSLANVLINANDGVNVTGAVSAQTAVAVTVLAGGIDIGGNVASTASSVNLQANTSNNALVNAGIHVGGNVAAGTTVTALATGGLAGSGFVDIDGSVTGSGTVSLTGQTGVIDVGSFITSTGGAVSAQGTAVTVGGSVSASLSLGLNATDGDLQVTGNVTSTNSTVTLDAQNAGLINITGDVQGQTLVIVRTTLGTGGGGITVGGQIRSVVSGVQVLANDSIAVTGDVLAGTTVIVGSQTGSLDLDGSVTAVNSVSLQATSGQIDVDGSVTSNTSTINVNGVGIDLGGNVSGQGTVTLAATNDGIIVGGNLTSVGGALSITASGIGNILVGGNVQAANNVSLSTTGAPAGPGSITVNGAAGVTSTTGSVALGADDTITVVGGIQSQSGVNLSTTTGTIDIGGNLVANAGIINVQANGSGNILIGGNVQATGNVALATTSGATGPGSITVNGAAGITSTNGNVVLSADETITVVGGLQARTNVSVSARAGAIDIGGDVTSTTQIVSLLANTNNLTTVVSGVHVGGNVTAGQAVSLSAFSGLAGTGNVLVDGSITANQLIDLQGLTGVVTVGSFITSTSGQVTVTGTAITIDGNVSALSAVVLNGTNGDVQVTGNIGSTTSIVTVFAQNAGSISVTGNIAAQQQVTLSTTAGIGGGSIDVGGTITSTNAGVSLVANDDLTVDGAVLAATTVTATTQTGAMTFGSTVTATAGGVTFTNGGLLTLMGDVTAGTSVLQNGAGSVRLCGDITAGASVTFTRAVELCDDVTINNTGGGQVRFQSTIHSEANQGYGLTVNTVGLTQFQGAIGDGTNQQLGYLITDAGGATALQGNVTTLGEQVYGDSVSLLQNVTLTAGDTDGDDEGIDFGSTLNGGNRTLTIVGGAGFAAAVTNVTTLLADHIDSESTISAGTLHVTGTSDLGGDVTTTGTQQYDGAVLLTADVTAESTGNANITFGDTVDGAQALVVNTFGDTIFQGIVGGTTVLASLETDGGGGTLIETSLIKAGTIVFGDAVTLQQSATVRGDTAVTFDSQIQGQTGAESLTVTSGGTILLEGNIFQLTDLTLNGTTQTTINGGIDITGALTTDASGSTKLNTATITAGTVDFQDAVELCQDLAITAGTITFGSTLDEAAAATGSDLTLTITDPNAAAGDITFTGAVGASLALDSLTITNANDVTFVSTVETVGDLTQQDGTGTTAFHGTGVTGIGGQLNITTDNVTFSTADMVTVGAIAITADNAITLNPNAGLNAGASTITLLANQDGTGTQGFTQADGTTIQTTSAAADAVTITVGGIGSAAIADIQAAGVVTITALGGAITDNTAGEGANITASGVALTAGTGIGGTGTADIDTAVDNLEAATATGGIVIEEADAVTLGGVNGTLDGVDVLTSGNIDITAHGSITVTEQISGPDDITLTATGANSDLTVQVNSGVASTDGNVLLSADRTVTLSEDVSTGGAGTLTVTGNSGAGARNIVVDSDAVISTVNGNLTLDADQGAQQTGNFAGIRITGANTAVQSTGRGNVVLTGRGGNDAAGSQFGVIVDAGALVQSATGSVSVAGTGGATDGLRNYGVYVIGTGAAITSSGGNVSVTGQGGGAGASGENIGIVVLTDGVISAGGLGTVTVDGTGGATTGNENYGVIVNGIGAQITSSGGSVSVTGHGGGSGASSSANVGVSVAAGGTITSGGNGAVTVNGTGGAGGGGTNYGVYVSSATISAGGTGNVDVHGTGGASAGVANYGVFVAGIGATITSSGGAVAVTGQGGGTGASGENIGVVVQTAGAISAGGLGAVTVNGTGGATIGNYNYGVLVADGGQITAAGGTVTVNGIGGASASNFNHGVVVAGAGSAITSGGGNVAVTGQGGGTGAASLNNIGVYVLNGTITAGGTGSVTVQGTGGATGGLQNYGVSVEGAGATITSNGGNVSVTGQGGGTGSSGENIGIVVNTGGVISAGGMGTVTVDGTGGATTGSFNYGVLVNGTDSQITSSGGNVSVTGNGGGSGAAMTNVGVYVAAGADVTAGGTGTVTVNGTGGATTGDNNYGVIVQGAGSSIASSGGAVQVTGQGGGGGTSNNNFGVILDQGGVIAAGGTGNVTVNGTGGVGGGNSNAGVWVDATGSAITSNGGNVQVTGIGGGTGSGFGNHGVVVINAATITAGGSGTVTVQGTGGATTGGSNHGVYVVGNGSSITSAGGNVSVTGQGGGTGAGAFNIGVYVLTGGSISAGANGTVTVDGTGGAADGANQYGVLVNGAGAQITSTGGAVSVSGQGGGTNASTDNVGVVVSSCGKITAGGIGTVTVQGTGGATSGAGNFGVLVDGAGSQITSANGAISITGTEGAGPSGTAIVLRNNGAVTHTNNGSITLVGNSIAFDATANISTGAGTVTILQRTDGVAINLGTAGDPSSGPLNLTDAELDRITTGELHIGNANSGAITVTSDLALTNNTNELCLTSGSTVTATAGGIIVSQLAVTAGGAVTFTDDNTNVDTVAITTTTGNVVYEDADGFTVGSVCGVDGIRTLAGSVTLLADAGNITVTDTGATTDIAATTGIDITLAANDALFTINSGANLTNATSGGVTLSADKMALNGTITATSQTVTLKNSVGADAINLGSTSDAAGNTLELSDAELDGITASKLVIGTATMGPITVSNDIHLTNNVTTLRLNTGSTVTATAGGIVVSDLAIVSGGAVTFTDADTNVTNLAIDAATGNVLFTEANGLTITTVDGVNGIDTDNGTVQVDVTTGNLTIANTGATNDIEATGAITLNVAANDGLFTINSGAVVSTTAGGVAVTADKMNLAGSITAAGQTVTLKNSVGADAIDLGSTTDAAGNTLELSDAELGRITANLLVIGSATTGAITVSNDINLTDAPTIPTLHLVTGSSVTGTNGGLIVANLAITAGGAVNLTDADNDVDQLAIASNGTTTFHDKDDLLIGTVQGVAGINSTGHDVNLQTNGQLTLGSGVGEDLTAAGATVCIVTGTGGMTEAVGSIITAANLGLSGSGPFTLAENNDVNVLSAQLTGAGSSLTFVDTDDLMIATACGIDGITTNAGNVSLQTGQQLTLGSGAGQDITATGATVTLQTTSGGVLEQAGSTITAANLLLLGAGTYTLDQANNVDILAANIDGTLAFTDANGLTIGTIGATSGITTTADDVKLTVSSNGLTIDDDITLNGGDLTLNVNGAVTQNAGKDITANGLQLLGTGTVTLTNAGNDVNVLAANYDGAITFTDTDELTIGTVTDNAAAPNVQTAGITTSADNVTLNTGGALTIGDANGQDLAVGNATVVLNSGAGVTQGANSIITADQLLLTGTGAFLLTQGNDVNTLAADIAGSVNFVDTDDLIIGTVNATNGISTGVPTNGGSVTITTAGDLTVNQSINTQGGTGGTISVTGGTINAALVAGAGNITLNGGNQDLIINVDQTSATTMNLGATRDVIINAVVTTTGVGADVLVTADSNNDGVGGVQVTAAGQVVSADAIVLSGSDLFATPGSTDSVRIDADGANDQLLAAGDITLQGKAAAAATTDLVIDGRIHSTGGNIVLDARDTIIGRSAIVADAGSVTFQDALVLSGALQVTAGTTARFEGTVNDDGNAGTASNLTVSAAGTTTFVGAVGNAAAIDSLTTNAGGTTELCGGSVTTVNGQTYGDAVVLCADTTLASTSSGTIAFQNTVNGDGVANRGLTVNTAGLTDFQGAVGNTQALASLTTNAGGTTQIGGGVVNTTGAQTYGDAVLLTNDAVLTSTGSGNVTFQQTVNGAHALTVNTAGTTDFQGAVGNAQALTSLTTDAAGTTQIGGGVVNTTGAQTYGDAVLLMNDAVLTSTGSGNVTFQQTLNGAQALTVNTAGVTQFQGAVGNTQALTTLTTDGAGSTQIGGGLVKTSGTQSYGDAVTLTANALLQTTANATTGADIAFQSTVATGGHDLTLDAGTQGDLTVSGALSGGGTLLVQRGDVQQFAAVTVDALTIQSATTSVTFHGPVNVTNSASVTSSGTITQESTFVAGQNVSYTAAGAIAVQGILTGGNDVTLTSTGSSINLTAPVTATNGNLTANANTTFNATQALAAGTDVSLTSGGSTTVGGTITAGNDVSVTSTGSSITLNGQVTAASDVTLQSATSTSLTAPVTATNGNLTATAGTTFNATHALAAGTDVSLTSGGSTTIDGTITAGNDISVTSTGSSITLNGQVTAASDVTLQSVTSTSLTAPVTATNGNLTATAGTTFNATQALAAGTDVSLTSGGATTVDGTITAGDDVSITSTGSSITLNGQVTANDDVTLQSATSTSLTAPVTATNGDFTATAGTTLSATQALTAATSVVLTATNGVTLGVNGDISATAVGGFVTINGALNTAADILTNNGAITLTGPVTLAGDVLWDSDRNETGGANILVQGTVATAGKNLTLDAGTGGDLTFQSSFTGGGNLLVQQGDDLLFAANVAVDSLTIQQATTSVTFAAPVSVTNSASVNSLGTIAQNSTFVAGQNVSYTAAGAITAAGSLTGGNDVTLTSTGSSISLTAPVAATNGNLTANANTTFSATQALSAGNAVGVQAGTVLTLAETADIVAGAGGVTLTAPQIVTAAEITTNSGNVNVTGAVTLTGDVTIDTGAAGSLLVTGTIDAQTAFAPSLFLSTGTGNLTVTGNVGSTGALAAVEISDANNVTFGGAITANHLLQSSGAGTTTIVGAVNTFDAQGIQLTTQSIQFAAGTASMDSHGNIITLTADAITLPTTFTKATGSTVTLQTLHDTVSIGLNDSTQQLNFTDTQLDTVETQNLIIGSATQTAGISVGTTSGGQISLDENLTLLTKGTIGVSGGLSLNGSNNLLLDAGNDISVTGTVATAAGRIDLLADDDLTMGANGLVTSTSGNVFVRADADANSNGTGGGITMTDGAKIVVGTGTLTLLADESIVLGQLTSNNATAAAIAVTSQHGAIVDGGDSTGPNIIATQAGSVVTLTAMSGVGSQTGLASDAALETQVAQLNVTNSTTGNIGIDEVDAITILGVTQNAPGNVVLTAGGTMTVALGGPGVQTQGGAITLVTTGAASDLVLNAAVNSRGGNIAITVGDDFIQSTTAPLTSVGGNITAMVAGDADFAANVASAGGNIAFTTGGHLTQATTAPITTAGGTLSETVGGNLLHQGAVTTSGGNATFDVTGNMTQTTTAPISTGGGHLLATVDGNLSLAAATSTAGGNLTATIRGDYTQAATAPVTTANGNVATTVGGALFMQDGALLNAGSGMVALQANNNVTLGQVQTTNATGNAVLIRSVTGGIIDGGDALGANIIANQAGAIVTLDAAQGIGSTNGAGATAAVETQIASLVATNSTTGAINLSEADALLIRSVTQAASGDVTVRSVGDLTLVAGQAGVAATSGTVSLAATGFFSNVNVNSTVQTTSGAITVQGARDVNLSNVAQFVTQSGNVTVTADADNSLGGLGGALTMADGAVINAGSGNIAMKADGNVTIGRVVTSSLVSLTSTSAGIVDGGDSGGADVTANALVIRAVLGIGSGNALDTAVAQLAAQNTAAGHIRINNDAGGLLTIGTIDGIVGLTNSGTATGPRTIDVVNQGGITIASHVLNSTGGDVGLTAQSNGGGNDDITVNAAIQLTSGNGSLTLTAADKLTINDSGQAVDVSVVNGGEILGVAGGSVAIGSNVVIQSATGVITDVPPDLQNVITPQINALGEGTITMTVQRPLEIGTVIIIDWGDGTIETFVVTEANQQTFAFNHQYLGPPNPLNPAADIPLTITILNPTFTTGAGPSQTPGTAQVDNGNYVPNIRFFADGEAASATTVGTLNQTVINRVFTTPGDGLASFAFDLTPPVELLAFPEPPKFDASLLNAPAPPNDANATADETGTADEVVATERLVYLEIINPDGSLEQRVTLDEDVLDDLDGVVKSLPNGRYRFLLQEPGESQTRLLQEINVRQGRIVNEAEGDTDRPPTGKPATPPPVNQTGNGTTQTDPAPTEAVSESSSHPAAAVASDDAASGEVWAWRGRSAWQAAVAAWGDADDVLTTEADAESADDSGVLVAGAGFGRSARLLRKHGWE